MAHEPEAIVLQPGEFGVILRSNRDIDLIVPPGEEDKPLADMPLTILGAVLSALRDPSAAELFKQYFVIAMNPVNKVAA